MLLYLNIFLRTDKSHSLNGFEESLPSNTHDSTSSSGSFTVPSFAHPRLPNDNLSVHLARLHSRPASLNHNVHDPHDLPQPLALSIIRSPSSGIRSPSVPSQPHEASKSAACTQPSVNVSPMTSGKVGCHCGTALDVDNSDAIFSNSNYSDVRGVTRQGSTVLLATRDVEQEEQARLGNRGGTRRGTVDEPLPTAVNVADQTRNEHGNEGERNVILGISGGYIHSQVYMSSGHRRRLEIPVLTASENAELSPQDRRGDSDGMEIASDPAASNQPITMSSPESSHPSLGPVVPALSASSLLHSDVPGQFIQGHDSEDQEIIANSINTQIAPSIRLMENRSCLGDTQHTRVSITLSCSGAGQPSIEEDAPPAYENAWAAARAVVTERRRVERSESRML